MRPFAFLAPGAIIDIMQELRAEKREILGKSVKTLRQKGFLPAVLYGEGIGSQAISVSERAFAMMFKEAGESTLLELAIGEKSHTVLIHDVSHDPLSGRPLHADFYAVRMDKVLRITVPVEFIGESAAVKNEGGVLVKVAHELEIEALPGNLPHALTVDISSLAALGGRLLVRDISVPKGVEILAHPEEVVAVVEAPRSDAELAALNEAVAATAEVKTVRELEKEAKAEAVGEEEKKQ